MRVLVTGGGGFIGSHIGTRCSRRDHGARARQLRNRPSRQHQRVLDEVELVEGDIQSYERANKAAVGCEVVLHQAALPSVPRSIQDPLTRNATNVIGTLNVLLAARDHGVRRVVCASSSSVYGAAPSCQARGAADLSDLPVRDGEARRRGLRAELLTRLRARDRRAALLQRVRTAPGSQLAIRGRDPELHHRAAPRASRR